MLIIGCDFHPSFQQVAIFDNRTGEIQLKNDCSTARRRSSFTGRWQGSRCEWGWRPCGHSSLDRAAAGGVGVSSCGWGMRQYPVHGGV